MNEKKPYYWWLDKESKKCMNCKFLTVKGNKGRQQGVCSKRIKWVGEVCIDNGFIPDAVNNTCSTFEKKVYHNKGKHPEHMICKNCRLFNRSNSTCRGFTLDDPENTYCMDFR